MKKALDVFLRVYSIFCMCIVTLLIIIALVVWINFGRIAGFAIGKVVDNYNVELSNTISRFLANAAPDSLLQFQSIRTVEGGGLYLSFVVDDSDLAKVDIDSYQTKTNIEIINDIGITPQDIPDDIRSILAMVRQTLLIEIKDRRGTTVASRNVSSAEISEFFRTK